MPTGAKRIRSVGQNDKPPARRRDSKLLQASSGQHVSFEELLATLSTFFTNLPAGEVDGALKQGLQPVVEWFGADRSTFAEISLDGTYATFIDSYAVSGAPPFPPNTVLRQFSWLIETLRRGEVVCVSGLKALPIEAWEEREYMRRQGFKSHLSVPIFVGKALGAADFVESQLYNADYVRRFRPGWPEKDEDQTGKDSE